MTMYFEILAFTRQGTVGCWLDLREDWRVISFTLELLIPRGDFV